MKNKLLFSIIGAALLFVPNVNFAQAPPLGTAANFVLFTSDGAVGNTPISQITGNVGTNNGAITGFGNVNGNMHTADGATTSAKADLLIAYNLLNAAVPTRFPAPALGGGDTLTAGIYQINGNTTLTDTLILDGQNAVNPVFIFKVEGGTFSSSTLSQVILINGALACNIFWKIEGAVSLVSGTTMRGNIIANNAAITLGNNVTLEGRALSTTGAVNVSGVFAYTPTGCGSPTHNGPPEPALRSTACFALFSSNGEVTNSGITFSSGDVGTNVGVTSGFDSLTVNGTIHPIPDTTTAQAKDDLLLVYNYLNLLSHDITLLYPAEFGRNLVLTPHTYIMNGAVTFTDTLYLNAEGNADGVFVIKSYGAFSTTVNAKVVLTNGAQAKNVFWLVEGALSLATNAVMKGTFIVNNAAINLNTNVHLEGRVLTTDGAVLSAAITANATNLPSDCNISPLPVALISFKGTAREKNQVLLTWATASESNSAFFTIERSANGVKFAALGKVNAAGNANTVKHYSFSDQHVPAGLNYYRLKQTDLDGTHVYSKIISVGNSQKGGETASIVNIFPNPVTASTVINMNDASRLNPSELAIYNVLGTLVVKINLIEKTTPLQTKLPAGVYFYQISGKNGSVQTGKLISQE